MENTSMEENSNDSVDVETIDTTLSETFVEEENIECLKSNDDEIESSLKPPVVDYEAIGEFCFESDSLALKGNNDYKNMLEAIVILEAQREKAVKDLDVLLQLQEEALAEPLEFVERLKRKENLNIPTAQRVHPVPCIDWGKYALSGDPSAFRRRQLSRIAADVRKNSKRKLSNFMEPQDIQHENWAPEEEKHLEELLVRFPPEKNETSRWEKIANCLENRSASQVANKVKKCFAKLIDCSSLSSDRIPGAIYSRKRRNSAITGELREKGDNGERNNYQATSSADEDSMDSKIDISDDEEISPDLYDSTEYQELLLYKRLLRKRIKSSTMTQHLGYKCSWCKSEPILGIRYHCVECKPPSSIDFCEDCVGGSYEIGKHVTDHQLEEIRHSNAGFLDRDYMHFLGNDYNYLDPNYMPAT